ncbi:MAG: response regulator [Candidatus Omnitrophica bacterium]|nr:response regulator [Candidatus Omnitrophota bacterium]
MAQKKILFVDDEPMISKIMVSRLKAKKYDVESAASGLEALEKAKTAKPDLILLDILMPGLDGYEVCRRLKEDPLTCLIPVIMFTACQDEEFIRKALQNGAEDVINKPFVAELLEAIQNVFEHKNEEDAA